MINNEYTCRFCGKNIKHTFVDLGLSPLANSYISPDKMNQMEAFFPLHALVCDSCLLVQLPEMQSSEEIFSEYAYFSSYSDSWLKHASAYADLMVARFGIDPSKEVIEIASNDGYLLQYFKDKGVSVLGIEPAQNVAQAAIEKGIPTQVKFFGTQTAQELARSGKLADLLVGNNVLAHVPELNDFVRGMKVVLKPQGVITMEFPHLMRLMEENQFDTIYHEHFSYFSFTTVRQVFAAHGLDLFDVEELPTHGGSLRIYGCHAGSPTHGVTGRVEEVLAREKRGGLGELETYLTFHGRVKETKRSILEFMIRTKRQGGSMVGYGAPAKGNTLLNYCGIGKDFLDYTVDRNPHKQDHLLPGSRIPIFEPEKIVETKPDYVVILPWNLKDEIMEQMAHIQAWNGKFVTLIPEVRVWE